MLQKPIEKIIASTIVCENLTFTYLVAVARPDMRYCDLPVADAQIMTDFYLSLPENERVEGLDVMEFIPDVGERICKEWCLEQEKLDPDKKPFGLDSPYKYPYRYVKQGYPGLVNFISQETHLELDRNSGRNGRLFEWNFDKKCFDHFNEEHYRHIRENVLRGLVLRGIDCYRRWGGVKPQKGSDENLRENLNRYVERAELMQIQ